MKKSFDNSGTYSSGIFRKVTIFVSNKSEKFLILAERIKGAAMVLIGSVIVWFAIDNYIKLSRSELGMAYIRIPRVLEWFYDNLGLIPGVALQILIGVGLAAYGARKIMQANRSNIVAVKEGQ